MIKFIQELITRNIGWKLFSLTISIILWCVIINVENPAETKSFSVYINFSGAEKLEEQNFVWSNESDYKDTKVVIKVRGNRLALDDLSKKSKDITATVNLNSEMLYNMTIAEGKTNKVAVNVKLPILDSGSGNCEVIWTSIQYVDIILEKLETAQKEVTILATGEPADGFVILQPEATPNTIQIKGAKSNIDKINSVRADVDITGISDDISLTAIPKAYDANGKEILNLTIVTKEIQVSIGVNKYKKIQLDSSNNQGMLAEGYTLKDIKCEPEYIEIVGLSETIDNITELKLPVFNLSGLSETTTQTYDIKTLLPENVSIKKGSTKEVKVTATIVKEVTKEFKIPIDNISVKGFDSLKKQYSILQENITLNLKGLDSILQGININDIKGEIDISNYDTGTYDIPIAFILPAGTALVEENINANIIISNIISPTNETQSTYLTTESTTITDTTSESTAVFEDIKPKEETAIN